MKRHERFIWVKRINARVIEVTYQPKSPACSHFTCDRVAAYCTLRAPSMGMSYRESGLRREGVDHQRTLSRNEKMVSAQERRS